MTLVVAASETPAVVAKRLSDLILCFPSAAGGGVQWQVLVAKYNERHSTKLDIASLGQSSPLAAATTLLWDVLRIVNASDDQNPVVAIEDCMALTAQPGAAATWPSLYRSLCDIVCKNGFRDESDPHEAVQAVLVSQLKPLLQQNWHSEFDECRLSYFTEQGKCVRVKKMKHLLQALLEWREARAARSQHTTLDEAISAKLELVPSKKHHDLLLRCILPASSSSTTSGSPSVVSASDSTSEHLTSSGDCDSLSQSSRGSADLMAELAMLRAENASLRSKYTELEQQVQGDDVQKEPIFTEECPQEDLWNEVFSIPEELLTNPWDSATEPPPFEYCGSGCRSLGSTAVPRTPLTAASASVSQSIAATPTTWVWDGQNGQICSMVPMWYVIGDRGLHDVPSGVVQQALDVFESHKVVPSFFTMGTREE